MITSKIKIGEDGEFKDSREYGLVFLSADSLLAAEVKDFDTTSYPEEEGEHIIPKSVDAPFDYQAKFFISPERLIGEDKLADANKIVSDFNARISTLDLETKVRTFKKIYFYNEYKGILIVGYAKPISKPETFWRDTRGIVNDVVVVEWNIRVTKPSECDFNYDPSN